MYPFTELCLFIDYFLVCGREVVFKNLGALRVDVIMVIHFSSLPRELPQASSSFP